MAMMAIVILEPGETWIYNATDYAMYGQYANLGTVTAVHGDDVVSDEDPIHYYGGYGEAAPSVDVGERSQLAGC